MSFHEVHNNKKYKFKLSTYLKSKGMSSTDLWREIVRKTGYCSGIYTFVKYVANPTRMTREAAFAVEEFFNKEISVEDLWDIPPRTLPSQTFSEYINRKDRTYRLLTKQLGISKSTIVDIVRGKIPTLRIAKKIQERTNGEVSATSLMKLHLPGSYGKKKRCKNETQPKPEVESGSD